MKVKFDWRNALSNIQLLAKNFELKLELQDVLPPPYTVPVGWLGDYTYKRFKSGGDIIIGGYATPPIIGVNTAKDEDSRLVVVSPFEAWAATSLEEKLDAISKGIFFGKKEILNDPRLRAVVSTLRDEGITVKMLEDLARGQYGTGDDVYSKVMGVDINFLRMANPHFFNE